MSGLRFPIDVPFKGERTYLHSTDIFDFLVAKTGARRNLRLGFRNLVTHGIEAVDAATARDPAAYPARFQAEGDDGPVDLVIEENANVQVTKRRPYDEPLVWSDSQVDGKEITSRDGKGASTIERIVALNKHLIDVVLHPKKKLLFSSIELSEVPDRTALLKLRLKSHLGERLFQSTISVGERQIGEIRFYGV